MKIVTILLTVNLILITSIASAQSSWKFEIKNTSTDMTVSDIAESVDSSIYFSGFIKAINSFHYNGFVYKLNSHGIEQDCTFYKKVNKSVSISHLILNPNILPNIIFLEDEFDTLGLFNNAGFNIIETDSDLNTIQKKYYSFPNSNRLYRTLITCGVNNNYIVYGSFKLPTNYYRMFIYNLDNSFDSLNAKYYYDEMMLPVDLHQLPNNSFWVMRDFSSFYAHIDSSLNIISDSQGSAPLYFITNCGVKWDTDTSFYFIGDQLGGDTNNDQDLGFFHQFHPFDSTGLIVNTWGSIDTNDTPAFWGALDYKNKDSIFIGGIKNINMTNPFYSTFPSWYVLLQTDSMLNIRWERFYGGDACYNMTKLIATNDGGCIMAGTRFDYKAHPDIHERDIYIIKVNAEGLITSTNGKPASIAHDAIVYPNPGSNFLKVRVAVQHRRNMFKLFDMAGRLVLAQNIEGKTAQINTTRLKTGTYVYTITSNNGLNEKGKWVKR